MSESINVLSVSHTCYLDTCNGASLATRALMECLGRRGFGVEVVSGTLLEPGGDVDFIPWMEEQGWDLSAGRGPEGRVTYRTRARGVPVTLLECPATRPHAPDEAERAAFMQHFQEIMDRFRPDVVVTSGGDTLSVEARRRARTGGALAVFTPHTLRHSSAAVFADADAVAVPSRFSASYYRKTLGLECTVLPSLVDFERVRADDRAGLHVTFVDPSYANGVYAFARIADELGRTRPDIPLLVVEGRGTERTLADCGLDLRRHGNVHIMTHTGDHRHFWKCTRLCVMPSLCWEGQGLVAVEAMLNGIPVLASDRGALPEVLGDAGTVLPLPGRLTPSTRELPTAAEVGPWVRAVTGLWDDPGWLEEQGRRAASESLRWVPDALEAQYVRFFEGLKPSPAESQNPWR